MRYLLIFLFLINNTAKAQQKIRSFEIKIIESSFLYTSNRSIIISFDSTIKITDSTVRMINGKKKFYSPIYLSRPQQEEMMNFLNRFPFKKIKKEYIEELHDGGAVDISVKINDRIYHTYIKNKYVKIADQFLIGLNKYLPIDQQLKMMEVFKL